jgi:hypothetical protein
MPETTLKRFSAAVHLIPLSARWRRFNFFLP